MAESKRNNALGIVLTVLGAFLRIRLINAYRFHADEALFATLARRILDGSDPLLRAPHPLVDKPPLFYYLLASGVALNWGAEWAARLPGLAAGIILIPLMGLLARKLWENKLAPLIAMALTAAAPLLVLYSPAALADPFMLVFWVGALVFALDERPGWAGVFCALALAVKQNALFLIPLVLIFNAFAGVRKVKITAFLLKLFGGFTLPVIGMVAWEAARGVGSVFLAGGVVNNPGRLARSGEVIPSLFRWGTLLAYSMGGWTAFAILIAGLITGGVILFAGLAGETRQGLHFRVIAGYALFYAGLLWLVAFPVFDRYLLPLALMLIMLAAGALAALWDAMADNGILAIGLGGLFGAVLGFMIFAINGLAVGPFSTADDRFDELCAVIAEEPMGTVVYTDSLGWQLGFYLYDSYIYQAVISGPDALAEDLLVHGDDGSKRFIITRGESLDASMEEAIRSAGTCALPSESVQDSGGDTNFTLFEIPEPDEAAEVCASG